MQNQINTSSVNLIENLELLEKKLELENKDWASYKKLILHEIHRLNEVTINSEKEVKAEINRVEENILQIIEKMYESHQKVRDDVLKLKTWAGLIGAAAGYLSNILPDFIKNLGK